MEALGIMGFIFGLAALGKILLLEKQLKEKGVLNRITKKNKFLFTTHSQHTSLKCLSNPCAIRVYKTPTIEWE